MGIHVIAKREAEQVVCAVDIERSAPGHWLKVGFTVDGWLLGAPLPTCTEAIDDAALDLGTVATRAAFTMPDQDALVDQLRTARDTIRDAVQVIEAHAAERWPPLPQRGRM